MDLFSPFSGKDAMTGQVVGRIPLLFCSDAIEQKCRFCAIDHRVPEPLNNQGRNRNILQAQLKIFHEAH